MNRQRGFVDGLLSSIHDWLLLQLLTQNREQRGQAAEAAACRHLTTIGLSRRGGWQSDYYRPVAARRVLVAAIGLAAAYWPYHRPTFIVWAVRTAGHWACAGARRSLGPER
jgi:hypothetical protein